MMNLCRGILLLALSLSWLSVPIAQATMPPVTNFAKVTVSIGYNSAATSVVLLSGHGAKLPAAFPFPLEWWNCTDFGAPEDDPFVEIVSVTARTSDTLTLIRAQEGTAASNHNTGGNTYCMVLGFTKGMYDAIRTDIAAAAGGSASILMGIGSPEGVVTATVGKLYLRTDSHAGVNIIYQKTSGTGNTGWLDRSDLASPGNIGGTTPGSGTFTTVTASGAITGAVLNLTGVAVPYSPTIAIDANAATTPVIVVTDSVPFTIQNPTNAATGRLLLIQVANASGGVINPTFDTLYKMADFSAIKPGNGFRRTVAFNFDGTNWVEIFCSPLVPFP